MHGFLSRGDSEHLRLHDIVARLSEAIPNAGPSNLAVEKYPESRRLQAA
jgi:hypothetical protein